MNNAYPYNYYFTAHTVLTYSSANSISSISTSEPYDIRIVKPFPSLSDVCLLYTSMAVTGIPIYVNWPISRFILL